jgi:hypothetical protein
MMINNNIYKSMMSQVTAGDSLIQSTKKMMSESVIDPPKNTIITRQFMPMMAALLLMVGGAAGFGVWLNINADLPIPYETTAAITPAAPIATTTSPEIIVTAVSGDETLYTEPWTQVHEHETTPADYTTNGVQSDIPVLTTPMVVVLPPVVTTANMTTSATTQRTNPPVVTTAANNFPIPPALKPLSPQEDEKIRMDYVLYLTARMLRENPDVVIDMAYPGDYKIMYYFGTYNGNSVVVVYPKYAGMNGAMQYIDIAGYRIVLNSGSFELLVHRAQPEGGSNLEKFIGIEDAFKQGILSLQNIHDISYYSGARN